MTEINCRSRDGIEKCKYHKKLTLLDKEIHALKQKIVTEAKSNKSVMELFKPLAELYTNEVCIKLSEYDDFSVDMKYSGAAGREELLKLFARSNKIPIQNICWSDYISKAADFLSPQAYGARVESLYLRKRKFSRVSSSKRKGDGFDPISNKFFEFKFSVMKSPDFKINLVQIRPDHDFDEYHIVLFDKEKSETEFYVLSKEEMNQELLKTNYSLSHGTRKVQDNLPHSEYSIRFKKGSPLYANFQKYRKPVTWN